MQSAPCQVRSYSDRLYAVCRNEQWRRQKTSKLSFSYRKDDRAMRPIYGCP